METIRAPRGTKISCKGWLENGVFTNVPVRTMINNGALVT